MSSTPPLVAQAPQPRFGPLARLTGALFSPGETFADIGRTPSWLAALLLLTITGLAVNIVLAQRVNWYEVTRSQIEKNKFAAAQFERMTDEQREQAYQSAAGRGKIWRYIRGAVGSLLLIVIMGGVYLGAFKLAGAGGALNFKTARAIVSHAYLPLGLREVIGIPILLLKDPSAIDPENFVASNVAALLPGDAPLWQIALGASVDIFGIWCLVLLVIGFSAFNPKKIPLGKAAGVVLGVFIFFVLLGTGIAWIFS